MLRPLAFALALAASTTAALASAQPPVDESSAGADGAPEAAEPAESPEASPADPPSPADPLFPSPSPAVDSSPPSEPTLPISASSQPTPDASSPRLEAAPGAGATLDWGDSFSFNVKARMQVRYQLDASAPASDGERELTQSVSIGTARIYLGGHAFSRQLTYLLQLAVAARDFRDGATSPIYDAFVDYRWKRDVSFKLGQYFVPFDRLRTVREFALQIAERPRVVQELTLDRDVGVTVYSDHLFGDASPVAYRVGVFGGGGTNLTTGKTPGFLGVARLELRPLGEIDDDQEGDLKRRERPGLALGVAGAFNWNANRLRSTTGPVLQAGVADYLQGAVDAVFKWRGFAVEGEFVVREASTDLLVGADPTVPPEATQSGYGWVAQASYCLPIDLELSGRLSELYAMDGTDAEFVTTVARTGQELAAGLSYYLNGHKFKVQADYVARMPSGFQLDLAQQSGHLLFDITL